MSRYREMQIFNAVAQAGSFASAARRLNVASVTVMRSVAALEARLGNVLVVRGPRGVTLSASGEAFASHAQLILQRILDADRSATGLHAKPSGLLTVSLPLLMSRLLMPVVLDYLSTFAEVRLLTLTRDSVPRLLEEGIDVALVVGSLPDSGGFAVPVGTTDRKVCAAPGYIARQKCPTTGALAGEHRLISVTGCADEWRSWGCQSGAPVTAAPALTCTTRQAAIQAAIAGVGLIQCFGYEVHEALGKGELVCIFEGDRNRRLPVYLLYREGRKAPARVRTFIDFATPRLREHPAFISVNDECQAPARSPTPRIAANAIRLQTGNGLYEAARTR